MADNLTTQLADEAKSHTIDLLRIESGMRLQVVAMLDELEKDLVKQLASTDLTTAKKERLQAFFDQTSAQVASAYKQINDVGADNLEKLATVTSKQTAKSLDAGLKVNVGTVLSPQQLTAIARGPIVEGSPMADWWAGQDLAAQRRFKGAVQQGLLLGEDMATIQRRVRGTKASGFTDGALSVSKREAQALTRTAVQAVANQAKIDTLMENDDVVKGIEWVATLDARTTKTCMALDGKQWRTPDLKPVGHDKTFPGPVAHWGCRSTQVAVTRSWAELANKPLKKGPGKGQTFEEAFQKRLQEQGFTPAEAATIKANQRASMDGGVSDAKDWQAWLTDKGDQFALEKLGPGRFKLWKEGKLTLTDLTDQSGRELTLAELEAAIDGGTIPPETEGREFMVAKPVPGYADATKAAAEALKLKQEAEAAAAAVQQQEDAAAATLADYKAKAEGQTLKNKWAKKVGAELPDATAVEQVAWVEAKAAEEQAAKSKAAALSMAKKKLVAGQPATPAQQKVIDSLTEEEKANFDEAVADAKANQLGPKVAALKAELDASKGQFSTEMGKKLGEIYAADPQAAIDVSMHAAGVQAEVAAEDELAEIQKTGHPVQVEAAKNAKGATNVEKLKNAKAEAGAAATAKLVDIAKTPTGQTLKHKALADALGTTTADLQKNAADLDTFTGDAAVDLLKKVEAVAAEKQAQASNAAKISGAKKKFLAGEPFTPAQQAAWDSLPPEVQQGYTDTWQELKAKEDPAGKWLADLYNAQPADMTQAPASPGPTSGGATLVAPDIHATNLDTVIPDPDGLVKIAELSGSTRPILAQDPVTGKKWVVKDSERGGGGPEHFQSEALADALYRAAGASVPASNVTLKGGKAVKVAEFLEGGQTLQQWKSGKSAAEVAAMHRKLQDDFVTDALLANWDVAGLSNDNILIAADGTPVRIDNGGALFFRAQGGAKKLPPEVAELKSLRDASVNAQTAAIFGGMTQGQIDDGILKLLARRDKILEAAKGDAKVQKALAARLDWLEKQLPASAKKTAAADLAPASSPGQIPANLPDLLKIGKRGAGTTLVGDGDAIEDHEIKTWREVTTDGTRVLKMEADLTLAGSDRILKVLADAGMDTSTKSKNGGAAYVAPKPAGMHPMDDFWQPIEAAAKTVSTHAADGQYNPTTLASYDAAKQAMAKLASDPATHADPELVKMLNHYGDACDKIDNAKAASKPLVKGELASFKVPTGYQPPTAPKVAAIGETADLNGWEVSRLDRYEFTIKQMIGDELHDTGVVNTAQGTPIVADYGRVFQLKKGPVEVVVMAFREDVKSNSTRRSLQGTVRVKINSTDDVAALEEGMQALHAIGIDTAKPSDAQRELLYLHKVVQMRQQTTDQGYRDALKAGTDEEKVEAVKQWAEKKYSVKLPRQKSEWGDAYNPDGKMPSNGTGSRTWVRWDYSPEEIKKITAKTVLFHGSTDPEGTFLAWVDNAGNATTTMGRVRTGVEIAYKGYSPNADMNYGGGNFLYASNTTKAGAQNRVGFLFKGTNLARLDLRSDIGDSYGNWDYEKSRRGDLDDMAKQTGVGASHNTGLLKNGINLFDELDELRTGNASTRASIIAALKARGFAKWPDGRKLEDVIK